MGEWFAQPLLLLLAPVAVALLLLFERWRRRPLTLVVADLGLFEVTPEVTRAAAQQRRRLSQRVWLRIAAALALTMAIAGLQRPAGAAGPVTVDLLVDRGLE